MKRFNLLPSKNVLFFTAVSKGRAGLLPLRELRLIHCNICLMQKLGHVVGMFGINSDADAEGRRNALAAGKRNRGLNACPDTLGVSLCIDDFAR